MYRIDRFGDNSVVQRGVIKIKYMNVEDYRLDLYIFLNIIVVIEIILKLLCCYGFYLYSNFFYIRDFYFY